MKALDRLLQRWRIRQALPFVRDRDRLLDVGCHDLELIDRVRTRLASAMGVDPLIDPARDGDVETRRGRFPEDFDFPDECFDCITMLAVFEHVEDPKNVARACERCLAPGGRVVLTVPHPAVDGILEVLFFLRLADGMAAEEHHAFDIAQTRPIFEDAGLALAHERRFELGLNRLYVFEKPAR